MGKRMSLNFLRARNDSKMKFWTNSGGEGKGKQVLVNIRAGLRKQRPQAKPSPLAVSGGSGSADVQQCPFFYRLSVVAFPLHCWSSYTRDHEAANVKMLIKLLPDEDEQQK